MKDVWELLEQMKVVCPVGCRVSVSMVSGDVDDLLILRWAWKSYHYQRSFTPYDRIRSVDWDRELDMLSHKIREYIKKTKEVKR